MENQGLSQISQTQIPPKRNWLKNILIVLSGSLVMGGLVFAGMQFGKNQAINSQPITEQKAPLPTQDIPSIISVTPANLSSTWRTAKFGGLFSYEYPEGWHAAELWQDNFAENGIMLAIDPNPISTAPRGGPLATFEITVLNGNKNPDEILAKKIADFNQDNYSDIVKETITADIGTIYHYKGKVAGAMLEGEPMERYFFTFNQNPNDPANQQVVVATLAFNDDPQLSAMLKHIVLSIKKLIP